MVDLALVNWDYMISIVISFTIAAAFMALYSKRRPSYTAEVVDLKEPMTEAVVSEYSRKLKYIEKMVIELRVRIDNLESREPHQGNSQSSRSPSDTDAQFHTESMTSRQESQMQTKGHITNMPTQEVNSVVGPSSSALMKNGIQDIQNGTMDYILKLLSERPRTSREIQSSIGRTREHTSRLMKRLYESQLVDRQSNSRPYKYTITETGRVKISVQPKRNSSFGMENASHDVMDIHARLQHNDP
jgi:DNA-binding HxlR family transcriptional regulator